MIEVKTAPMPEQSERCAQLCRKPTDGVFEKGAVVREKETGQQMIITQLGIALIERHHFFQGLGSRYRIDPEVAVRLLGLASFKEGTP